MTIAVADSWEGRSTSATLDVPVSGIEPGDMIVVITIAAGATADVPTDDGGNAYAEGVQVIPDATWSVGVSAAYGFCDTVPTQVSVSNSAGGAADVAAVVMRVTHDGTGWFQAEDFYMITTDDPTTVAFAVGDGTTTGEFPDNGNAVLVAALSHDGATTTFAPQSGWADVEEEEDASSGLPYSVVSKSVTTGGPHTHQWATGASRDYSYVFFALTERVVVPVSQDVQTAPTPMVSGLTLEVVDPDLFPDPTAETFFCVCIPPIVGPDIPIPSKVNSEIVRVVGSTGDVWDIERAQWDTLAQPIDVGWEVWWATPYLAPLELLSYLTDQRLNQ